MVSKFAIDLLDSTAASTIETVTSGKQSPADNIRTIATFVEMCNLVERRFNIDEVPFELSAKLDAIDRLYDANLNELTK